MNNKNALYVLVVVLIGIAVYLLGFLPVGGGSATGVIFTAECPKSVTRTQICSVEIIKKTENGAVARIHYHYVKNNYNVNRIVVTADQGKHDNIIGIQKIHRVVEGDNFIDVAFGLFKGEVFSKEQPYLSQFIFINIREVDKNSNIYIRPEPLEFRTKYNHPWYGSRPNLRRLVELNQP